MWVPQKGQDWGISLQPRDSAGRGGVSSGRVSVAVKLILVGRSTLSADVEAGVLRHATDTARRTGNRRRSGSGRRSCSKRQQHAVHIVCCAAIRHVASFCRSSVTDGGMALTVFPPSCLQSPEGSVNETSPSKAATGANLASRSTPVNGARRAGLALKAPQLVPRNFHSVGKDVVTSSGASRILCTESFLCSNNFDTASGRSSSLLGFGIVRPRDNKYGNKVCGHDETAKSVGPSSLLL